MILSAGCMTWPDPSLTAAKDCPFCGRPPVVTQGKTVSFADQCGRINVVQQPTYEQAADQWNMLCDYYTWKMEHDPEK